MDGSNTERLAAEVDLLQAMYPGQMTLDQSLQDLTFTSDVGKLNIRIPSEYPASSRPDIISATTKGTDHKDLRSQMKEAVGGLPEGEECLDSLINAFIELAESVHEDHIANDQIKEKRTASGGSKKTVLIWLHHLLNTNKRKQALASIDPSISGLSKPGYPGVLIFSGPASNVDEHVHGLKVLNWAAFQIRLEEAEEWAFEHGHGVKEVESMGDVVKEIGEQKRVTFLEVMKMK